MAEHQLEIDDKSEAVESHAAEVVERHPYRVISEVGLFKNGKQLNEGDIVQLDAKTAAAFMAVGDVTPIEETE